MNKASRLRATYSLVVFAVGFAAVGWTIWSRLKPVSMHSIERLGSVEGSSVTKLTLQAADGTPHEFDPAGVPQVIYVFTTSCPACRSQKNDLGRTLASVTGATVTSLSPELPAMTRSYWDSADVNLNPPKWVSGRSLTEMGIPGVPTLLLVDKTGIVRRAFHGVMQRVPSGDLHAEIAAITQGRGPD